MTKKNPKITQ